MSQTGRDVAFAITAKADAYRMELEKLPGWTAEAARKSSDAWAKAASASAAKEAAGIKASASVAGKAWGDVGKQVGALAGGPFAQLSQVLFELGPKASSAAGSLTAITGLAAGAAATAAAVALIGVALFRVADAGLEAEKRLRAAGDAALIDPEAAEGLRHYEDATKAVRRAWDLLVVDLGGRAGNVIAGTVQIVGDLAEGLGNVEDALMASGRGVDVARERFALLHRVTVALGTLGMSELVRWLERTGSEAEHASERVKTLATNARDLADTIAQSEAETEEDRRRASAARADKAIEDAKKQAKDEAEARAKAGAAARKAALAAELAEYQRQGDLILAEAEETARGLAGVQAAELAEYQRQGDLIIAESERVNDQRAADAEALTERLASSAEAQASAALDEIDRLQQGWRDSFHEIGQSAMDLGSTIEGALIRAAENGSEAQKRAALRFAIFFKAANLAQATISGFQGVAVAAASAPPPSNIPAIAAALATGAAQVGGILATPLPSLFGGTAGGRGASPPGEEVRTLHQGEPVLTSRTTEALLRLLNERLSPLATIAANGAGSGGGAMGDTVVLDLRGRKVGMLTRGRAGGAPPGYRRPG